MKVVPTIHLDLRTDSARQMFTVSLAALSDGEIKFLAETFARADRGTAVEFGVGQTEDGRQCMQFTIGKITEASNA
jgi:hypothetical protein